MMMGCKLAAKIVLKLVPVAALPVRVCAPQAAAVLLQSSVAMYQAQITHIVVVRENIRLSCTLLGKKTAIQSILVADNDVNVCSEALVYCTAVAVLAMVTQLLSTAHYYIVAMCTTAPMM
jgi:hypothetical protein